MTLTVGRRTTTVPAIDTNQAAGGELDLTYWADDMTAGQTVGGTTTSFSHDPLGRADTQTTTITGGATTTLTQYYAGPGDSPAWSSNGTNWNWYLPAPTGGLALTVTGTGTTPASATLALVNPHGDITATIPNTTDVTATQISALAINDEYGQPLTSDQPQPYQWLGAAQRSNNGQAGIIQMGARQYNPASGRFLTLDPVPGGNPNPYTYPTDLVNQYDLDGQFSIGSLINTVVNAVIAPVRAVAQVAKTVFRTVTSVARNAWRAVTHIAHTAARTIRTIASTGAKWAGRAQRATRRAGRWARDHTWLIAEKKTVAKLNHQDTGKLAQDAQNIAFLSLAPDAASGLGLATKALKVPGMPWEVAAVMLFVTVAVGLNAQNVADDARRAYANGNCAAFNSYRLGTSGFFGVDEVPCG